MPSLPARIASGTAESASFSKPCVLIRSPTLSACAVTRLKGGSARKAESLIFEKALKQQGASLAAREKGCTSSTLVPRGGAPSVSEASHQEGRRASPLPARHDLQLNERNAAEHRDIPLAGVRRAQYGFSQKLNMGGGDRLRQAFETLLQRRGHDLDLLGGKRTVRKVFHRHQPEPSGRRCISDRSHGEVRNCGNNEGASARVPHGNTNRQSYARTSRSAGFR